MRWFLLALLALPVLADDKEEDAAKKIAALRDRLWKERIEFSADGTREQALRNLADASGISLTIPDDVRKDAADALATPVSMVFRDASLRHLLDSILSGSRLFSRLTPDGLTLALAPAPAEAKPGPGPDIILVATFVESSDVHIGRRVGRTFWLRIEKVARLRNGDPKADEREFTELFKRSADLDDTNLLQASILFREDDADGAKELDRLTALFKEGGKFIVSSKSARAMDTLGTIREHKWGEVRLADAEVEKFSEEALKGLEEGK